MTKLKKGYLPGSYIINGLVSEQDILDMALQLTNKRFSKRRLLADPKEVKDYLSVKLSHVEHEVFCAIFLDNKHRILEFDEMFRGTIDGASVYPREVVKKSLKLNAAAIIFVHNHPSGSTTPSRLDINITNRLKDILALVDVRVLDHFIVGGSKVLSMAEEGHI